MNLSSVSASTISAWTTFSHEKTVPPSGSLTRSCKINNPDLLEATLSELMYSEMTGEETDIILMLKAVKQFENIEFIPSNISLSGTETMLFNCMSRESVLKRTLETMKSRYDVILIDCMPSLGMMTINALVAADSVIIPCEPSYLSVKEKRVKELICGVNGIKYVNLPENLPETEIISMIRKAFAESRIYLNSDPVEDLERIKASYTRWRKA